MKQEYYVIVDLDNLTYTHEGESVSIKEADKFDTIEKAQTELSTYDDDFNGAIYKVVETVSRRLELAEKG